MTTKIIHSPTITLDQATDLLSKRQKHNLINIDELNYSAFCTICNKSVMIERNGVGRKWRCLGKEGNRKHKAKDWSGKNRQLRNINKSICNRCGFIPDDPCQMDIHHVDRDHSNQEEENLEILCSNCHRLEHRVSGDGMYSKRTPQNYLGK